MRIDKKVMGTVFFCLSVFSALFTVYVAIPIMYTTAAEGVVINVKTDAGTGVSTIKVRYTVDDVVYTSDMEESGVFNKGDALSVRYRDGDPSKCMSDNIGFCLFIVWFVISIISFLVAFLLFRFSDKERVHSKGASF